MKILALSRCAQVSGRLQQNTRPVAVLLTAAAVLSLVTGCQSTGQATDQAAAMPVQQVRPDQHANFNAVLWYQTSAEFRANSLQTYRQASALLATAKADPQWTAWPQQLPPAGQLPVAIVVDIDETILDNSPAAAQDVLAQANFSAASWDRWVSLAKAAAVPGAVDFVNQAEAQGIKVLYISNRECSQRATDPTRCPQKQDTLKNLQAVGIKQVSAGQIWLKAEQADWGSEKESRRQLVLQQYRVIMSIGDDLGDFLPDVKKNITPQQRAALVDQYQQHWGSKFFMLTNPTYGSWETILQQPKQQYLQGF